MADKKTYLKILEGGKELILRVMDFHLPLIQKNLQDQIFFQWDLLNEDEKYLATHGVKVTSNVQTDFRNDMSEALAEISSAAIDNAMNDIGLKRITLAEKENSLFSNAKLDKLNTMPSSVRKRIEAQSELFTDSIIGDYTKNAFVVFNANWQMEKAAVNKALDESSLDFISGVMIGRGADIQSAQIVNESRNAVFLSDEAQSEVEAFQFWNPNDDRTTPLCSHLAGQIFSADDPNFWKYQPPLHFNCRSTYLPLKALPEGKEISILELPEGLQEQIQF